MTTQSKETNEPNGLQITEEKRTGIERLVLPKELVLLDVNGTLMPDDQATKMVYDASLLSQLQAEIARLTKRGYAPGLCSDSSLYSLTAVAEEIGIAGCPILAEGANVISYGDQLHIATPFPDIEGARQEIVNFLTERRGRNLGNIQSMEFGGPSHFESGEWGFDPGRVASIGLFAHPELIVALGQYFQGREGISTDVSPEYFYFCIHPGMNYKDNKALTLKTLQTLGHQVRMIGNSRSDYVPPETGVRCSFVNDPRLFTYKEIVGNNQIYISGLPQPGGQPLEGVIDCLRQID